MALTDDQKRQTLTGLLSAVDQDVFNNEMQAIAYQAEVDAAPDEANHDAAQANLDNTNQTLNRLYARRDAWQAQLDKLPAA